MLLEHTADLKPHLVQPEREQADLLRAGLGEPPVARIGAVLGLYASPAYLADRPAPTDAADLAGHRLVGYVDDLIAASGLNYAGEFLRDWRSSVELTSAIGQVEAVRAGAGIGILHDYLARKHALTPVLPQVRAVRSYWLAIHEALRDVARVRAVANFVTDAVVEAQDQFLIA
jgi:DNA-binding transcriptional LysR family regulator